MSEMVILRMFLFGTVWGLLHFGVFYGLLRVTKLSEKPTKSALVCAIASTIVYILQLFIYQISDFIDLVLIVALIIYFHKQFDAKWWKLYIIPFVGVTLAELLAALLLMTYFSTSPTISF